MPSQNVPIFRPGQPAGDGAGAIPGLPCEVRERIKRALRQEFSNWLVRIGARVRLNLRDRSYRDRPKACRSQQPIPRGG
jgi:hypothetical protein